MDGAAVIAAYHDLWKVEQSFRMTKGDLRAPPVFHHQREAIEAHLTVVFAALAVARHLQDATGTRIKKIVQALRTARSATIEINGQRLTPPPRSHPRRLQHPQAARNRSPNDWHERGSPDPAGAAGVAALVELARLRSPVLVVLSGGNIDPLLLSKLLRHGLTAAVRYLAFRCRLPDHPGSLAKLLGDLADLGPTCLRWGHERLGPRPHVDEAEVVLVVETRGPGHREEVIGALRSADYTLAFS